ncbi:MAG: hypothetical protein IPK46_08970 [Saprospiraceae bacterium]|nr:hypothetical protein [Saprospiraceae bacterium]
MCIPCVLCGEITHRFNLFLFDYNHPVNKLALDALADSTLTRWRTEGKILYLRDDDYRDDFFSHSNFLPRQPFLPISLWSGSVDYRVGIYRTRSKSSLNSLPGSGQRPIITIALLSAIFIL